MIGEPAQVGVAVDAHRPSPSHPPHLRPSARDGAKQVQELAGSPWQTSQMAASEDASAGGPGRNPQSHRPLAVLPPGMGPEDLG